VALKEMTTTIDCERHTLEFDAVPEYLRDTQVPTRDQIQPAKVQPAREQLPTRDAAVSMSSNLLNQRIMEEDTNRILNFEPDAPKSEELEVLWPGVHHEHNFTPPPKRSASFYISVGFAAGALISLAGVFGFFSVSKLVTASTHADNKILIAGTAPVTNPIASPSPQAATGDTLVPSAPQYQVQAGDTLAGIAYKNYKRVSPRLLDEIVKANNMRSANVLNLGQKLTLPEYHPSNQIAATTTGTLQ
jgi:LysM repeat protein